MDILTLYVDQGSLSAIRVGNEAIIIDAHMPTCDVVTSEEIQQTLSFYLRKSTVRGLLLTGFDSDHAHANGVDWILTQFNPEWVMYPKYYKDTVCAGDVFNAINRHEPRRKAASLPFKRHSIRLDKLDSRDIAGVGLGFSIEVFSPHVEDMDSSNNCSIVAKIVGSGAGGFSYLATGDTETGRWETINRLFGAKLTADVMSASHHGSKTGVHVQTVCNINPNTVLISAGVESEYGHPDGAALRVYQSVAKHVFATNAGDQAHNMLTRRDGADFKTTIFQHAMVDA